MKLSLALATHNEEANIVDCIQSCNGLVDEVVLVDGSSSDKTAELAQSEGAKVIITDNPTMFHINKQKAIDACTGEWILQLDADERVTPELAQEIKKIISMSDEEIDTYESSLKEKSLFERHQRLVESSRSTQSGADVQSKTQNIQRHPEFISGSQSEMLKQVQHDKQKNIICYNAFFIPRLNYFLGGYLCSGGVYPDGVIRLIRKGKAHLPCKNIHELMEVDGKTGWLANPLIHKDSPTFKRYLERNSRYIDHLVGEMKEKKIQKNFFTWFDWVVIKPKMTFFSLVIRHKGIMDGWRGIVFAFFSAIRFARAYYRYIRS